MTNWVFVLATEGGLFDFDGTLLLMAVQFIILMLILDKLLYKPLGKAIDERSDYVRSQYSQAKEQKEKSLNLAQQYEEELRQVRRESQEIVADAQAEAKKIVSDKVQAAQQEVITQRQQASEEIAKEKAEALSSLEQQVDALSSQIVEKIIGPELAK